MDRAHDRRSWTRSTLIYTDSDTPSPSCLTRARVRTRPSRAAYDDLRALSPYLKDLFGVVVESTFNWYWLVDGLIEAGHSVHLANTVAIKQYDGLKYRGDESDALHLAHILRLGLLPEGHIMPPPLRAVRELSRKRMQLVQQRTTQFLSIGTCMAQQTGGQISGDSIKRLTEADIDKMPIGS